MELKSGYKQTEVGLIPDDWDVTPLGELATFLSGGTPSRSNDEYWTGDIPWISATSLRCFYIYRSGSNVTKEAVAAGSKMAPIGATLLLVRGSALHNEILSGLVTKTVCFNQDVKALVPNSRIAPKFLTFVMLGRAPELLGLVSSAGNTAGVLDTKLLKVFEILLPTLAEQEAIAEALSDADALIDSLEQLIAKKRLLKQGAMQDLLTGNKRLPGFEGEWEVKTLGGLADLYQSETIAGSAFTKTGFPVYGANGVIGFYHRYNHEHPQITISCRGNCGTVNRTVPQSWITGNAMVVNLEKNRSVDHDFLFHLLREQDYTDIITGSGQPQIVRGPLGTFEISLPPTLPEQTAIAAILSDMDAEIAALEAKLAKARQVKQGMMQELLTGRTRLV